MVNKIYILIVLLAVLLTGCKSYMVDTEPVVSELVSLPDVEMVECVMPEYKGIVIAPSYITVGGVSSGGYACKWQDDLEIEVLGQSIVFNNGDPLSILVVNSFGSTRIYKIKYADIMGEKAYCNTLGNNIAYAKAPEGAKGWIYFKDSVVIPQGYAAKIPIVINIPEDVILPNNWEFRITVSMMVSPNQELAARTRFLLSK